MFKMIVFYPKPNDADAFIARFKSGHVPLLMKLPGVTGIQLNIVDKNLIGESTYWAYSETYFPTIEALKAALKSPEMMTCGADAMSFAAGFIVTTGHEEALA